MLTVERLGRSDEKRIGTRCKYGGDYTVIKVQVDSTATGVLHVDSTDARVQQVVQVYKMKYKMKYKNDEVQDEVQDEVRVQHVVQVYNMKYKMKYKMK